LLQLLRLPSVLAGWLLLLRVKKKEAWLAHRNFYLNDFQIMLVSSLLLQLQMMLFSIPIRAIVVCIYFARDLQEFFKEKLTFL